MHFTAPAALLLIENFCLCWNFLSLVCFLAEKWKSFSCAILTIILSLLATHPTWGFRFSLTKNKKSTFTLLLSQVVTCPAGTCPTHFSPRFLWDVCKKLLFVQIKVGEKGQIMQSFVKWQLLMIGNPFCIKPKANLMPSKSLTPKPSLNIFHIYGICWGKWKEIKNSRYVQAITNCGGRRKCRNLVGWLRREGKVSALFSPRNSSTRKECLKEIKKNHLHLNSVPALLGWIESTVTEMGKEDVKGGNETAFSVVERNLHI